MLSKREFLAALNREKNMDKELRELRISLGEYKNKSRALTQEAQNARMVIEKIHKEQIHRIHRTSSAGLS